MDYGRYAKQLFNVVGRELVDLILLTRIHGRMVTRITVGGQGSVLEH